jgi:hypothetical protein
MEHLEDNTGFSLYVAAQPVNSGLTFSIKRFGISRDFRFLPQQFNTMMRLRSERQGEKFSPGSNPFRIPPNGLQLRSSDSPPAKPANQMPRRWAEAAKLDRESVPIGKQTTSKSGFAGVGDGQLQSR